MRSRRVDSASTFHQGGFCGITPVHGEYGFDHAHLLRSGQLTLMDKRGQRTELSEPSISCWNNHFP